MGPFRAKVILWSWQWGVARSLPLGMARIIYGIRPLHLHARLPDRHPSCSGLPIQPLYPLLLMPGAVATGPMTVTFVMAMAVGVCDRSRTPKPHPRRFGLIALIARRRFFRDGLRAVLLS